MRVQHDLAEEVGAAALGHAGDVEVRQAAQAARVALRLPPHQALRRHLAEEGQAAVREAGEQVPAVGAQAAARGAALVRLRGGQGLVPAGVEVVA